MEVGLSGHDESKMPLISQPNCQSKDRYHDVAWQQGLTMHFLSCLLSPSPLSCMKFNDEVNKTIHASGTKRSSAKTRDMWFRRCLLWYVARNHRSRQSSSLPPVSNGRTQMVTETTWTCLPWRGISSQESWNHAQSSGKLCKKLCLQYRGFSSSCMVRTHQTHYGVMFSFIVSLSLSVFSLSLPLSEYTKQLEVPHIQ